MLPEFQAPHRAHSAYKRDAANSTICRAGEGGVGGTLDKRRKAGGGLGPPRELLLALVGEVRKDRHDALVFVTD